MDGRHARRSSSAWLALIVVPTFIALAASSALARRYHIICIDGGVGLVMVGGRGFAVPKMCDVDRRCDGICTFAVNTSCLACHFGRACSPGSFISACSEDWEPPCPSDIPTYAVRDTRGGPANPRFGRRRLRIGRARVVLDCLSGGLCSTTTTTLPPGVPNLSGDWVFAEESVTHDCPPAVAAVLERHIEPTHPLQLEQNATELIACTDRFWPYHRGGIVSASGFSVDSGECCSIIEDEAAVRYTRRLSGVLPTIDGRLRATEEWDLDSDADPNVSICTRTAVGTMTRTGSSCTVDADCIGDDACTRCLEGRCTRVPGCRYDPRR
jgi:hypothetical protein